MDRNRLGEETSPYLLQHKDNPVHWQPWGAETLATAKAKDKPTTDRYRQIAKDTMEQASFAAKRLQISADNAADSYARSMRNAAAEHADSYVVGFGHGPRVHTSSPAN